MNGEIAQLVALGCHANARLRGLASDRFWPGHSTTVFCEHVTFIVPKGNAWVMVARDPDEWLDYLARTGTVAMRCRYERGREAHPAASAGFVGGGGIWMLDAIDGAGVVRTWRTRWQVGDRSAPDRRIWRVEYGIAGIAPKAPPRTHADLGAIERALAEALERIRAFAIEERPEFVASFEQGLAALRGEGRGYHRDLAPEGVLAPDAQRLLDACQRAWVFGGMGSWNDGVFGERCVQLTDALFDAITSAITGAVNSGSAER